jgi:ATP-dependent Clp protease adapter protein ClpS
MTTTLEPKTDERVEVARPWNVILFNDDVHSFEEVILQLQKATGCSLERAGAIAQEAHNNGKAVCFTGPLERCEIVAAKLYEIRLDVALEKS